MTHEEKQIHNAIHVKLQEFDDFISLVRRMREAQKRVVAYNIFEGVMKYKDLWEEAIIDRTKLEQEVDEYLKKINENI